MTNKYQITLNEFQTTFIFEILKIWDLDVFLISIFGAGVPGAGGGVWGGRGEGEDEAAGGWGGGVQSPGWTGVCSDRDRRNGGRENNSQRKVTEKIWTVSDKNE